MAAPKKRGRQAALEQLSEKQATFGTGLGGAGLLSPQPGGGSPFPAAFGATAPSGGISTSNAGRDLQQERMTFAERVGDVKQGVERARAEYRSKVAGALGAQPSAGPSPAINAMHSRFSDLEAAWGEVMDYANIDPFSTSTPGVNAASLALSRNRGGLENQLNAVIADLWDGVSAGQHRSMTDFRKDNMMQQILSAPGNQGRPLSPNRHPQLMFPQQANSSMAPGAEPLSPGLGLSLQLPDPHRNAPPAEPWQDEYAKDSVYPPPVGAQDFETRRQLEIMRQDILRLEDAVLQAVEAEEANLPPPPPLIQKGGLIAHKNNSMKKADAYEEIFQRISHSVVGAEPDIGGTPCNSVDNPNIAVMMPPRGGINIRKQIEALTKEANQLQEDTIREFGGEGMARRMRAVHGHGP
jgi:hypothetical protein